MLFIKRKLHGKMLGVLLLSTLFVTAARCEQNDAVNYDILQLSDKEIIRQLVTEIQQLKTDRDHDRQIISDLMMEINDLKKDNTVNKERILELERTVETQNDEMVAMRQAIEGTTDEKTRNKQNSSAFNAPNPNAVKDDMSTSSDEKVKKSRRIVSVQPVAFSSYISQSSDVEHLGAHQNIVFDQTFINIDNVYNVQNGMFTVPVPGIYVITATILSGHSREAVADIIVNGRRIAPIFTRGTDGRHDQGSQTVLLQLHQGDTVAVQNVIADDAVYGASFTTFSGFLLY